ncbi:MAG: bifunctional pyr operon transcriptional regulator/uracil phosphoribosyltransferase PyrR [Bacteroidota bacterium]
MARSELMSPARVRRTVTRLAYEVREQNRGAERLVVFGLKTRGRALATMLAEALEDVERHEVPVHSLDVTGYRDDTDTVPPELSADAPTVSGRDVLIVDDVLFTGRTARAALDAVVAHGRPRSIQLAVLVDRGHREVPVQPDFVGRRIPTKHRERVIVDTTIPAVYLEE